MDEEKITLPANKMRARNADFQSDGKKKHSFHFPPLIYYWFRGGNNKCLAYRYALPVILYCISITAFLTRISLLSLAAGYPLSNKRPKSTHQEVKEQEWPQLREETYGSTSSSMPKKPHKIPGSPGVAKSAAVATTDSDLLLFMRTGAKRSSPDGEVAASTSQARGDFTKAVTTPGSMFDVAVKSSSFPERLMELFEGDVAKDAMWWLPGEDAFALSSDLFPDQVLQKYFQGTKFESFTRKLNRW
jgi:hypothetical protein